MARRTDYWAATRAVELTDAVELHAGQLAGPHASTSRRSRSGSIYRWDFRGCTCPGTIAAKLPAGDRQAASEHLLEVLDVRLDDLPPETRALVRSMLTVPEAEASMREFLQERVDNLQGSLPGKDAELRAALVVSSILGLTIARHFLRLPAFDTVSRELLVRAAHAWLAALTAEPGQDPPRLTTTVLKEPP